jgi:hypothetical protein
MEREPKEIYFCREHQGVACTVKRDGIVKGYMCSEGGEWLSAEDMVEGVAWVLLWEELGYEENPFTSSLLADE